MDVYTQALTATKRKAQSRVVELIVRRKRALAVAPGLVLHTDTWTDDARSV
jgi:hypothetical protein